MKTGLVLEGGAMRGMYTAGVCDVLMENNIEFDGAVGVSAGAAFGCNYKSKQIGRTIRYNKRYCRDKRYVSIHSLLTTGDLYGEDFCYRMLPEELDPFDTQTFSSSLMEFYVTCTNVITGEPVYHKIERGDREDTQWIRASASMPLASRVVEIDGYKLLDGGMSDSIPIKFFQSMGYEKNVVILTQHDGYIKKKNKFLPLMKLKLGKYKGLIEAVKTRHIRYNDTLSYIKEQALLEKVFVIQPSRPLEIGAVEHNPEKLEEVYQLGRQDAESKLEKLKEYLR